MWAYGQRHQDGLERIGTQQQGATGSRTEQKGLLRGWLASPEARNLPPHAPGWERGRAVG